MAILKNVSLLDYALPVQSADSDIDGQSDGSATDYVRNRGHASRFGSRHARYFGWTGCRRGSRGRLGRPDHERQCWSSSASIHVMWLELIVQKMAGNLTDQVREIAEVVSRILRSS